MSMTPWIASSPPVPRIAAPRIFRVSASTTIFMKPCVSPFSIARPTRLIGADDLRIALDAVDPDGNAFCMRRQPDAFGAGAHGDAFALKDLADRLRDVLILAADETRCHFDDRHPGAEPPVYLREFEADIAAADDD